MKNAISLQMTAPFLTRCQLHLHSSTAVENDRTLKASSAAPSEAATAER